MRDNPLNLVELPTGADHYKRLVDSNLFGVILWDKDGGIFDANDCFLEMIGYTRADLAAGRIRWDALTPPEHAHLDARGLAEVEATGRCAPFEKEYLRKDGTRVPVLLGATCLERRDRGICFIVDLSAKRSEEAMLARRLRQQAVLISLGQRALTGASLEALFADATHLAATALGIEFSSVLELC
ncbi:MAG TPA: PAS domain-containing protein, partial [Minicystis sp.]|nr:PAS domain-containing protein [Minicystis sp.]